MTGRLVWVDMLRGLSMMAILWFHTEVYYAGHDLIPYGFYVCDALAVFYFLSGYLFCRPGTVFSPVGKLRSVIRRLLIPYLLFTLLLAFPKAVVNGLAVTDVVIDILLGRGSWFVASLVVAECLMTAAMAFGRWWAVHVAAWAALVLAVWLTGSSLSLERNYWYFHSALLGLWFMYLGLLYRHFEARCSFLARPQVLLLLLVLLLVLKAAVYGLQASMLVAPVVISSYPLFLTDCVVSIWLCVAVAKRLPALLLVVWTGRHSLVYYFFCGAVPSAVSLLLGKLGYGYDGHYYRLLPVFLLVYMLTTLITWLVYGYLPWAVGDRRGRP